MDTAQVGSNKDVGIEDCPYCLALSRQAPRSRADRDLLAQDGSQQNSCHELHGLDEFRSLRENPCNPWQDSGSCLSRENKRGPGAGSDPRLLPARSRAFPQKSDFFNASLSSPLVSLAWHWHTIRSGLVAPRVPPLPSSCLRYRNLDCTGNDAQRSPRLVS